MRRRRRPGRIPTRHTRRPRSILALLHRRRRRSSTNNSNHKSNEAARGRARFCRAFPPFGTTINFAEELKVGGQSRQMESRIIARYHSLGVVLLARSRLAAFVDGNSAASDSSFPPSLRALSISIHLLALSLSLSRPSVQAAIAFFPRLGRTDRKRGFETGTGSHLSISRSTRFAPACLDIGMGRVEITSHVK